MTSFNGNVTCGWQLSDCRVETSEGRFSSNLEIYAKVRKKFLSFKKSDNYFPVGAGNGNIFVCCLFHDIETNLSL